MFVAQVESSTPRCTPLRPRPLSLGVRTPLRPVVRPPTPGLRGTTSQTGTRPTSSQSGSVPGSVSLVSSSPRRLPDVSVFTYTHDIGPSHIETSFTSLSPDFPFPSSRLTQTSVLSVTPPTLLHPTSHQGGPEDTFRPCTSRPRSLGSDPSTSPGPTRDEGGVLDCPWNGRLIGEFGPLFRGFQAAS